MDFRSFSSLCRRNIDCRVFLANQLAGCQPRLGTRFRSVFAACLLWGGIAYKLPEYIWLAVLALLLGVLAFAAGTHIDGMLWVMVGMGLAMAFDGALRVMRFPRTHPVVEDHGEDRHG
jgi:hypothetical protein